MDSLASRKGPSVTTPVAGSTVVAVLAGCSWWPPWSAPEALCCSHHAPTLAYIACSSSGELESGPSPSPTNMSMYFIFISTPRTAGPPPAAVTRDHEWAGEIGRAHV